MANAEAWQIGAAIGSERAREHRAHKQALSDQELQGKIQDLIGQRSALVSKISSLDEGTPEYKQAFDTLKQVNTGLVDAYHPQKNPGAIDRLGHLLTDHLKITSPEKRQEKQRAEVTKKLDEATRQTAQQIASGPPSPSQEATAKGHADLAQIQAAVKNYVSLNPDATPEEKQTFLSDLIQKTYGTTVAGNWKIIKGTLNGQPASVLFDSKTRQVRTLNGEAMPPELLATWVPETNTSADANKRADFEAYKKAHPGYQGTFEQWSAQQGTIGRTGASLKYNAAAGQVQDLESGKQYSKDDPNNPPEVAAMFKSVDRVAAQKEAFQVRLAQIRGASYGTARQMAPLQVLDTANGNAPGYATYLDMKKNPGRYIPATAGAKAISQENLMEDLTGVSANLRKDINAMTDDFPLDMKSKIAVAATSSDPSSALQMLIGSGALGALPPDQFQVYVDLQQLAENAMAMRSVLGAGQGSDDVRRAITRTLPSLLSPNKQDALVQLNAYDQTIARLRRGVPKVPLRTDIPQGGGNGDTNPQTKGTVSIKEAKKKPEYKSMTDDQVKQAIESHGYTAVP